jgi:hypothetical protein
MHRGEEAIRGGNRSDEKRASNPDRNRYPVKNGGDCRHSVPEGILGPEEAAALPRKGRAKLSGDQTVRNKEGESQEHEPGKTLCAILGSRTDRIDADESTDQEKKDIEATKVFP